jgi:hypothetical protein
MDAAISPIRDKRLGPALFPQVAAIASSVTISSFNHDGTLFHNSGAEGQ